jgi:hypothetical protein
MNPPEYRKSGPRGRPSGSDKGKGAGAGGRPGHASNDETDWSAERPITEPADDGMESRLDELPFPDDPKPPKKRPGGI